MAKTKQTPIQRINRIQKFNLELGNNKESVNNVQRKILMLKFNLWQIVSWNQFEISF